MPRNGESPAKKQGQSRFRAPGVVGHSAVGPAGRLIRASRPNDRNPVPPATVLPIPFPSELSGRLGGEVSW